MDAQKPYEIDRKTASRLLRISTRSVDRYIRTGKLPARRVLGRVFISREEAMKLQNGEPVVMSQAKLHSEKNISQIQHQHDIPSREIPIDSSYRNLYENALRALDEKNHKLEQTQYRIGQLESQVTSPYAFKALSEGNFDPAMAGLRQSLLSQEKQNAELAEKARKEKLNRNILAAIVYILLILQPILWYFLKIQS